MSSPHKMYSTDQSMCTWRQVPISCFSSGCFSNYQPLCAMHRHASANHHLVQVFFLMVWDHKEASMQSVMLLLKSCSPPSDYSWQTTGDHSPVRVTIDPLLEYQLFDNQSQQQYCLCIVLHSWSLVLLLWNVTTTQLSVIFWIGRQDFSDPLLIWIRIPSPGRHFYHPLQSKLTRFCFKFWEKGTWWMDVFSFHWGGDSLNQHFPLFHSQ